MDRNERAKEVSEDATRESLIAISYTAPEQEAPQAAGHPNEKVIKENGFGARPADSGDKLRSELISISNSLPACPSQPKGLA